MAVFRRLGNQVESTPGLFSIDTGRDFEIPQHLRYLPQCKRWGSKLRKLGRWSPYFLNTSFEPDLTKGGIKLTGYSMRWMSHLSGCGPPNAQRAPAPLTDLSIFWSFPRLTLLIFFGPENTRTAPLFFFQCQKGYFQATQVINIQNGILLHWRNCWTCRDQHFIAWTAH